MFFLIAILIFGLLFVLRICKFNERTRIFNNQILKNVLLIIIFLTLTCCYLFFDRYFFAWFALLTVIFLIAVTIFVTIHFRERKFRQDFVDFLDRVILQVRSGHSFRNSLESSNVKTAESSRFKLEKIIEAVHFSQKIDTKNSFVREVFEEFSLVQRFSHKTLDRLCAFRRKIKIEDNFRRKSGRIVRQVRIQITFLLLMYVGVLFFIISRFGFTENLKIILWSAGLFVIGIVGFFTLGTRGGTRGGTNKQWKI